MCRGSFNSHNIGSWTRNPGVERSSRQLILLHKQLWTLQSPQRPRSSHRRTGRPSPSVKYADTVLHFRHLLFIYDRHLLYIILTSHLHCIFICDQCPVVRPVATVTCRPFTSSPLSNYCLAVEKRSWRSVLFLPLS